MCVHALDRQRVKAQERRYVICSRRHVLVSQYHERRGLGHRHQRHSCLRDNGQRALRTHEELRQIRSVFRQEVLQRVPGDLTLETPHLQTNSGQVLAHQIGKPGHPRVPASGHDLCAVREEGRELVDVIGRAAVGYRVRAARIITDHSTKRGAVLRGGIRPEAEAVLAGLLLQARFDHTGLDACRPFFRIDLQDLVHVAGKVQNDSRAHRIAGARGAGPSRGDRHARFARYGQCGRHIVRVLRVSNDERNHAVG